MSDERDAAVLERLWDILSTPVSSSDVNLIEARTKLLRVAVSQLSSDASVALAARLRTPDDADPLSKRFGRLSKTNRELVLGLLHRNLQVTVSPETPVGDGAASLTPRAATTLLNRLVDETTAQVLNAPERDRLARAQGVLRGLRSIASQPRLADAERAALARIENDIFELEGVLERYGRAKATNVKTVTKRRIAYASVGFVGLASAESGPAAALLVVGGLFIAMVAGTTTTTVVRDPRLRERTIERVTELIRETRDSALRALPERLQPPEVEAKPDPRQIVRNPKPKPSPQPTEAVPLGRPIAPPLPDEFRRDRRRRDCTARWAARSTQDPAQLTYCSALVRRLRVPAPEDLEFVLRVEPLPLTFDTYDCGSDTYYSFFARSVAAMSGDPLSWVRRFGLVRKATAQRVALDRCGRSGAIVWIFEDAGAAASARSFLTTWPLARVLVESSEVMVTPKRRGTPGKASTVIGNADPRTASGGIVLVERRINSDNQRLVRIVGRIDPVALPDTLYRRKWPSASPQLDGYDACHLFPLRWGDESAEGFMYAHGDTFNRSVQGTLERLVSRLLDNGGCGAQLTVEITALTYTRDGTTGVMGDLLKEMRYVFTLVSAGRKSTFKVELNVEHPPSKEIHVNDGFW